MAQYAIRWIEERSHAIGFMFHDQKMPNEHSLPYADRLSTDDETNLTMVLVFLTCLYSLCAVECETLPYNGLLTFYS